VADRYDARLDDLFDLQDQIAASVAGAIEPKLLLAEIERTGRKPLPDLRAYDLYLRALAQFHRHTWDSLEDATVLAEQALVADPHYGRAAALAAICRVAQAAAVPGSVKADDIAEAIRLACQALETGRNDPEVLWMVGNTLAHFGGDHASARELIDRALHLNPNSAIAWLIRGWLEAQMDRPAPAVECFERSVRLSPFDPLGWNAISGLALAALIAGRFEDAVECADRALHAHPGYAPVLRYKAVACARLGRGEQARRCVDALLADQPGFTVSAWRDSFATTVFSPRTAAMLADGLQLAGAPE